MNYFTLVVVFFNVIIFKYFDIVAALFDSYSINV